MNSATFIANCSLPLLGPRAGMGAGFAGCISQGASQLNSRAGDHGNDTPPGEASA